MNAFDAWCLAIDTGHTVTPIGDGLIDYIRQIGPGALFIAGAGATWWALDKTADTIRQRPVRRAIRRLESYANHPGARALLDDIENREEEL